jgi:hypothetical protein
MHPFEGFIDRVEVVGEAVTVRLVVAGFDPQPNTAPILLVEIVSPTDSALFEILTNLQHKDSGCYFSLVSQEKAVLISDHGTEVNLHGSRVSVKEAWFDGRDYERLAKQNYEWCMSSQQELRKQSERVALLVALATEQRTRLRAKIQGHAPGTTAHTLYEQHLSFLSRLLDGEA